MVVLKRILAIFPILFLVSIVSFALILLMPGSPATSLAGENSTAEQIAAIEAQLGLDQPVIVQYFQWLGNALTGDLGESWFSHRAVTDMVFEAVPVTVGLTVLAIILALLVGVPVGLFSGSRVGKLSDRISTSLIAIGVAIPNFWLAIMLVLVVALGLGLAPAVGYVPFTDSPIEWLRYSILPAIALAAAAAAETARQLRGSVAGVLQQDHVRTARAMGIPKWKRQNKYVLRNGLLPVVTLTGVQFARLFGGAVIIEQLFSQPGIGQVALRAIGQRDVPVIQGIILVAAVLTVLVNLVVDLLYTVIDPRLRKASK